VNECLILKGNQDRAVWICKPDSIRLFVCGVGWRTKFTKESWIHDMNCLFQFSMLLPT